MDDGLEQSFSSDFNMGIAKLYRIDAELKVCSMASKKDDFVLWKKCLDSVRREIWAYLNIKKDKKLDAETEQERIDRLKKETTQLLSSYTLALNMQNGNGASTLRSGIMRSVGQTVSMLVDKLDEYQCQLICSMKAHDMDMTDANGTFDPTQMT